MREIAPDITRVLAGRYQLEALLGAGGMGSVYRAHDRLLERTVAVKIPSPTLSRHPAYRERFRREARAAARLNHANVVTVYDWGEEAETPYLVMEFVDGRTLHALAHDPSRERGPLRASEVAGIGAQLADALAHAHRQGLVHRDVKPGNVLLTAAGVPKLTDFGIAQALTDDALTQPGLVLGTAAYVAPEQARGDAVDGRSDVFSLGVLLGELAGTWTVGADATTQVVSRVDNGTAHDERDDATAPPALAEVVRRATEVNPAARYQRAEDLRDALLAVARRGPVHADHTRPLVRVQPTRSHPRLAPVDTTSANARTRSRRRVGAGRLLAGAGVATIVAVAGLVAYALVDDPTMVEVPAVAGQDVAAARTALRDAGLHGTVTYTASPRVGNVVLRQTPRNGRAAEGSDVRLVVSRPNAVVPNVVGDDVDVARAKLASVGLVNVTVTMVDRATVDPGRVIGVDPPAAWRADKLATVTLTVARDPNVRLPNLVRLDRATAVARLEALGLVVRVEERSSSSIPAGQVVGTSPTSGKTVERGDAVVLTISTGKASKKK